MFSEKLTVMTLIVLELLNNVYHLPTSRKAFYYSEWELFFPCNDIYLYHYHFFVIDFLFCNVCSWVKKQLNLVELTHRAI